MKYLLSVIAILSIQASIAQVYKFKAFQTHLATQEDRGKHGTEVEWSSVDILVVINLDKNKINTYGAKEGDYDLLGLKNNFKDNDGTTYLIYSAVDENGIKCTVRVILFQSTGEDHIANLVFAYPEGDLIFRLKKDI